MVPSNPPAPPGNTPPAKAPNPAFLRTLTHGSGPVAARKPPAAPPPAPDVAFGQAADHQQVAEQSARQQQVPQQPPLLTRTLPSLNEVRSGGVLEDVYFLTKPAAAKRQHAQPEANPQTRKAQTTKTLIGTQPPDHLRVVARAPTQARHASQHLQQQQPPSDYRPTWPSAPDPDERALNNPYGDTFVGPPHQSPAQSAQHFPQQTTQSFLQQAPRQSFRKSPSKMIRRSPWKHRGKPIWKRVYPPPRFPASVPLHPLVPPRPDANLTPRKLVEDRWLNAVGIFLLGVTVAFVALLAFITVTDTRVAALEPFLKQSRSILPMPSSSP